MHDDTARIVCEAKIINQLFARRGLSVHVPKAGHGGPSHYLTPTTVVYDLTVPMHVSGDKLVAQQDDALAYVRQFRRMNRIKSLDHSGMEVMPTVRIDRYEHTLEVSRPQPDMLPWKDAQWTPRPYTAFCGLRYSHEAPQPVLWDLSRPDQPHGLIAGTTGSGKTNTLLDVLYSLMLHNEPATLRLFVCDPKHSDGMQFLDGLPHVGDVARTLPDVLHRIETFYNEMLHREQGATAKDQRYVLAIEECASLTEHPDKQIRSRVLYWLADIARRSRENNMNLIVCTQKPTADVLGDQLKSNLSMRLVGAVNSKDDALTALNVKQSGAEMLPGYGSFIYRLNRTMFRFQAPLIDTPMGLHRAVVRKWGEGQPVQTTQPEPIVSLSPPIVLSSVSVAIKKVCEQFSYTGGDYPRGFVNAALTALNGGEVPTGTTFQRLRKELDAYLLTYLQRDDSKIIKFPLKKAM